MSPLLAVLCALPFLGFMIGYGRARNLAADRDVILHSQPIHHGVYGAIKLFMFVGVLLTIWQFFTKSYWVDAPPTIELTSILALVWVGVVLVKQSITPESKARTHVERAAVWCLALSAAVSIVITIAIVLSVVFEAIRFFQIIPIDTFLFGTHWSPQSAAHGSEGGAFGSIPLFVGTLLITGIAMLVAVPVGLFSAIYMAEYASSGLRNVAKPVLEILAGIPTVVYGYFAVVAVAPLLRNLGADFGVSIVSESALGAGLVMGIMIIPFISSLSDDVITAVPQSLRDASLGLGATRSETIRGVVLPAAIPGIAGAVLLAMSRAIGETMIVVMAAGLNANMTFNPLEAVTTVTVQIVSLLVGDQEFDSAKTLAAFALGLTLFFVTLLLNVVALIVVKKYREQ